MLAALFAALAPVSCGDDDGAQGEVAADAVDDTLNGDLGGADAGDTRSTDGADAAGDGVAEPDGPAGPCDPAPGECDEATGTEVPGRLSEHAAAYADSQRAMIVFGGTTAVPENCDFPRPRFVDTTWIYDDVCGRWKGIEGGGPSPRGRHMMAYGDDSVWLFGGRWRSANAGGDYTLFDDLWRFDVDGESWEPVAVEGTPPPARVSGGLAWDDSRGMLWLVGGNQSASGFGYDVLMDVWSFDPETLRWTEREVAPDPEAGSPLPRNLHVVFYDAARDRLVLYGGADNRAFQPDAAYFADVWALDLDGLAWEQLDAGAGFAPEGRFFSAMVHDTEADRYLLFGGHDDQILGNRNDVWAFLPDSGEWRNLAEGDLFANPMEDFCSPPVDFVEVDPALPERRSAHTMVWAAECGHALVFAGKTDCGASDDLWTFADGTWVESVEASEGEACIRWRGSPDNCANFCF